MKLKFLILVCFSAIIFQKVFSQSCVYTNHSDGYTCVLTLINRGGFDNFTQISGNHLAGRADDDVRRVVSDSISATINFPSIICEQFQYTEKIEFVEIGLEVIGENALRNCKNLNYLTFRNNRIREISSNAFGENSNLTYLDLDMNELSNLPANVFQNQLNLRDLFLNWNQIENFADNFFDSLTNLETLRIANNYLSNLQSDIFDRLTNLLELNIQANGLETLDVKWFERMTKLERLYLNNIRLTTIPENAFDNLTNLQRLDLFSNQIEELPKNIFSPLKNLYQIYLFNNRLKILHSDSFNLLPNLTRFEFNGNQVEAVDEKLIDNTGIVTIYAGPNPCVNRNGRFTDLTETRSEIRAALTTCFDNYLSRDSTTTTTSTSTTTTEQPNECEVGNLDERICQLEQINEDLERRLKLLEDHINILDAI